MSSYVQPPASGFVRRVRKVYNPLGFSHGYNFVYWFIFAGALFGFVLARFMYLNFDGVYCPPGGSGSSGAAPGQCYWFQKGHYKIGIKMHLATILPAGLLVVFQFTPFFRYSFLLFHRINGYIVITLLLLSNISALMIVRRSFGGHLSTQTGVGVLAIGTTFAITKAYVSIKRLEIHKHRMWMLRTWFWAASIITLRIIFIIMSAIITSIGSYHDIFSCEELLSLSDGDRAVRNQDFPACANIPFLNQTTTFVAVQANLGASSATTAASLNTSFGSALWLALLIHAVGLEIYFHYTQGETERLRQVSLEKQAQRKMQTEQRGPIGTMESGRAEAGK
ncbi:MAG: hypothetical protein M1814_002898 [Vezdaea aestivalis]|nr:MAG: hypothetical protein M1814_002898 [Vezdaea aestivalis]